MQDITLTIVLGIITGLVTASILLILKSLFFNSFLPWYRQIMYRGVDLNGTWYRGTNTQKTLLELKQRCEKITGKATAQLFADNIPENIKSDIHIDDIRTFDVTGVVSERFVSLSFWHTDRTRLGLSTYLLQVDGDGTKLTGQACWYAPVKSKIKSGEVKFFRDKERMMHELEKERIPLKQNNKSDVQNNASSQEDSVDTVAEES